MKPTETSLIWKHIALLSISTQFRFVLMIHDRIVGKIVQFMQSPTGGLITAGTWECMWGTCLYTHPYYHNSMLWAFHSCSSSTHAFCRIASSNKISRPPCCSHHLVSLRYNLFSWRYICGSLQSQPRAGHDLLFGYSLAPFLDSGIHQHMHW